jgi:hypothetical protein
VTTTEKESEPGKKLRFSADDNVGGATHKMDHLEGQIFRI